jgi:hypothetical protein
MRELIEWTRKQYDDYQKESGLLREEGERREFIERLDERSTANYRDSMNATFSLAYAFLGGMMLTFASTFANDSSLFSQRVDIPDDRISDDDPSMEDKKMMVLGFCSFALIGFALEITQTHLNKKFFKASRIADAVKDNLSKMSPQQIENALERIQNDELPLIRSPQANTAGEMYKFELKYAIAGILTSFSGIPDDEKYLFFTAAKAVAGFAIDMAHKREFAKQVDPVNFGAENSEDSYMVERAANSGLRGQEQIFFDTEHRRKLAKDSFYGFKLDLLRDERFAQHSQLISDLNYSKCEIASDLTETQWQLLQGLTEEQRKQIKDDRFKAKTKRLFPDNFFDDFSEEERKELGEVLSRKMSKFSEQYSDPKKVLSEILTYLSFSMTLHYAPVSSRHEGNSSFSSAAIDAGDFGVAAAAFHSVKIAKDNIAQKWRDRKRGRLVHQEQLADSSEEIELAVDNQPVVTTDEEVGAVPRDSVAVSDNTPRNLASLNRTIRDGGDNRGPRGG